MSEDEETGSYGKNEGFEVLERRISGSTNVLLRKEAEDIFRGLWELPEL
jgi:hypothetical protein